MKNLFSIIITFLGCSYFFNLYGQDTTSIYVSPHPDDWQLFMNPNAYNSIKNPNEKVVFIHITAGDSGTGISSNKYLAREEGSLRAIRFMSNTFTTGAGLGTNMNETIVTINGHNILKYTYRNATAYFLRLPDGSPNGSGYLQQGFRSVQRLYNGIVPDISAIDTSTQYNSLTDLRNTLRSLIEVEATDLNDVTFNLADDDDTINPADHSDHIYSSKIMQDIANTLGGITINLYSEYDTGLRAQNVFDHDYLVSAGTWGATTSGLSDNLNSSTWDRTHNSWIGKQYYRTTVSTSHYNANIALNKPTSASGNELNSLSSEANDNNYSVNDNYWAANPYSQWWQVDLEDVYDVNKIVVINYYDGSRYYQYDIQASIDGINWVDIIDFNNNIIPASSQGNTFESLDTTARYLRVNMNYNSANTGVHIVEFEAYGDLANPTVVANIALNKPTSASGNELNSLSSEANDNNYSVNDNYWAANPYSQWWQVDLEDVYDVNKIVVINYYDGSRYYQYDIQASIDGTNWVDIIDFNNNTIPASSQGNTFESLDTTARYLRINMNYNSANVGVHIVEFEAYGEKQSTPIVTTSISNTKNIENSVDLNIYPNPVTKGDDIEIDLDSPVNGTILVEVYDFNGKSIISKTSIQNKETKIVSLNTSDFTTGLNVVNITYRGETITKNIYIK
ncbi:discoidin domain-containing protein [Aquimarina sp. RZ0]|uniref:galactose-binding domain-containing protein n=1 Tax=Aquimarina sp. RZ0 TaxID=2607730 RepID=UPI0011F3E1B1|nr:discoidin domain-containing protein [Aquimarina sp. RZ0]KAA1245566.1 T9SS type A sorting domain-containing protein [Aquimarina sp. RZ0]